MEISRKRLAEPAPIHRQAEIASGVVFWYGGRPLRTVKRHGDGPDAPMIVEELTAVGNALPGQYALWSAEAVARALANMLDPTARR